MAMLEMEAADAVLARMEAIDHVPSALQREAEETRHNLDIIKRRWKADGRWRRERVPGDG